MAGKWWGGIIELLFHGIADNTRGHFTHCSRVLSVKPSNKVYIITFLMHVNIASLSFKPIADPLMAEQGSMFKAWLITWTAS